MSNSNSVDGYYKFANVFDDFAHLRICVNPDCSNNELKEMYNEHINKHNEKILNDHHFYNSGFDLLIPKDQFVGSNMVNNSNHVYKIDHQVSCSMTIHAKFTGYYMYPRSSIIKTPMRLANSVGIIDAGYRGNIIAAVDSNQQFSLTMGDRYFQICAPTLCPIYVELVDDLGEQTARGSGGFGSTGR